MAETEPKTQNLELGRIIFVDKNNLATEIQAIGSDGRSLLEAVMTTLIVARNAGLVSGISLPTAEGLVKPNQATKQAAFSADLFKKVFPKISLPEEHRRQSLILARLFTTRLGFESEEAYMATLPQFPEIPSTYEKLGLKVPLIVETRVPWLEAAELSHDVGKPGIYVSDYLKEQENADEIENWEDRVDMSKGPIAAWTQDGTKFVGRIPSYVRKELRDKREYEEYRAGLFFNGISLWNLRPDMVRNMFWDLIGNKVGSGGVPYLGRWGAQAELDARDVGGHAEPDDRALVFGSKIETLDLAA